MGQKMKKILVIGIKGMAGHVIYNYLKKINIYEVYGIARNIKKSTIEFDLDVSNTEELSKIIEENNFDFVINCIGILNKNAEDHPVNAIWFNSYFPHFLEEITKNTRTQIIHISTDCVFDGKKGGYRETDFKNGEGFYAQSKALGEIINNKDLTIRTSIIGPELNIDGIGLFHWFMNQSGEINGYTTAYWSGVTTLELAKALYFVIEKPMYGLVHLTNGIPINKFDLISLFRDIWSKDDVVIKPYDGKIIDKTLQKSSKLIYEVPSYKDMLEEQNVWMKEFANLYMY